MDRKLKGLPRHLLPLVHEHYFEPKYEAFEARTLWSLSNAFTSAFKELNPLKHFEMTARLGAFLSNVQNALIEDKTLPFSLPDQSNQPDAFADIDADDIPEDPFAEAFDEYFDSEAADEAIDEAAERLVEEYEQKAA